ncbi:MAG: peptidase [Solirubrobacterales bacterium]|nr:peptidase [Solirubrobacterales bacterium]
MDQSSSTPPPAWLPPGAPAPAAPTQPAPFGEPERPWWRRVGGWLAAAGVLLLKFGKIALLALPKLKVLTTSGSMLVSVAAYSLIWGWKFALGFVILLFVHEMGHVIQLRREGVEASAPLFIPFLGALVWAKSLGGNALAEARVGLAGPVLGSIGAALCIPIADATGNEMFRALAFTGFFLNLFNLLPVVPLDGGRAMAAMSPWLWFVGFFGIVVAVFIYPNPIIILIAIFAGLETYRRYKALRSGDDAVKAYYKVRPRDRLLVAGVYLGLIALLVWGMDATHVARDFSNV